MTFRYYTTQRPPMLGCIPNGAASVACFDDRQFVEEIGRRAWGYADYPRKLTDEEIKDYELTERNADD